MALEWLQHFSHYKSTGIFPDDQGQLTPQYDATFLGIKSKCKSIGDELRLELR